MMFFVQVPLRWLVSWTIVSSVLSIFGDAHLAPPKLPRGMSNEVVLLPELCQVDREQTELAEALVESKAFSASDSVNQEQYKALVLRLGNAEHRDGQGPRHTLDIKSDGHCGFNALSRSMCYSPEYQLAEPIPFQALRHDVSEHIRPILFGEYALAHLDILARMESVLSEEHAILAWSKCETLVDVNPKP